MSGNFCPRRMIDTPCTVSVPHCGVCGSYAHSLTPNILLIWKPVAMHALLQFLLGRGLLPLVPLNPVELVSEFSPPPYVVLLLLEMQTVLL